MSTCENCAQLKKAVQSCTIYRKKNFGGTFFLLDGYSVCEPTNCRAASSQSTGIIFGLINLNIRRVSVRVCVCARCAAHFFPFYWPARNRNFYQCFEFYTIFRCHCWGLFILTCNQLPIVGHNNVCKIVTHSSRIDLSWLWATKCVATRPKNYIFTVSCFAWPPNVRVCVCVIWQLASIGIRNKWNNSNCKSQIE